MIARCLRWLQRRITGLGDLAGAVSTEMPPTALGFAERKQIVGKANRVLLSFDKNHRYAPRFGRTFLHSTKGPLSHSVTHPLRHFPLTVSMSTCMTV